LSSQFKRGNLGMQSYFSWRKKNEIVLLQMQFQKPPLQKLSDKLFEEKRVNIFVLRLELIHPFLSGNKYYKLKYNLKEFFRLKKEYLVTFGGAFSNHIVATAAAGKEFGVKTIGIIRGEELHSNSNEHLRFASACGMKLVFVSREAYRPMRENKIAVGDLLYELRTTNYELIPEGGSNELAIKGCEEIVKEISVDFDFVCCAVGTGATLAGISRSLPKLVEGIGISVLQGETFLEKDIREWIGALTNFKIINDYSFGGYAKANDELIFFCKNFNSKHEIEIEPVYTGKLFFGLYDLIGKDFFKPNSTIVAVHSGGIFTPQNSELLAPN
jgi:1-aminocyclopropane-1-carboxylate deaminase